MTDEESMKAFAEWTIRYHGGHVVISQDVREAWQASSEYHTQRERERCADLCRKVAREVQIMIPSSLSDTERFIIAEECALVIEQEPTK